jgi:hypothetical protein
MNMYLRWLAAGIGILVGLVIFVAKPIPIEGGILRAGVNGAVGGMVIGLAVVAMRSKR